MNSSLWYSNSKCETSCLNWVLCTCWIQVWEDQRNKRMSCEFRLYSDLNKERLHASQTLTYNLSKTTGQTRVWVLNTGPWSPRNVGRVLRVVVDSESYRPLKRLSLDRKGARIKFPSSIGAQENRSLIIERKGEQRSIEGISFKIISRCLCWGGESSKFEPLCDDLLFSTPRIQG